MNEKGFFAKVWASIIGLFSRALSEAEKLEHSIAVFADTLTNIIKNNSNGTFLDREILEALAKQINPALVPLVSGLELEIPYILSIMSKGKIEIEKPIKEQIIDFLNWLENIKNANSTIASGNKATLNAAFQRYLVDAANKVEATDAQLLTAGQAVHAVG